jgi:hypothetical protein
MGIPSSAEHLGVSIQCKYATQVPGYSDDGLEESLLLPKWKAK